MVEQILLLFMIAVLRRFRDRREPQKVRVVKLLPLALGVDRSASGSAAFAGVAVGASAALNCAVLVVVTSTATTY